MTAEQKAEELDKWLKLQKRWLHEKISLGKIYDVIEKAFYEGIDIGFKDCAKARLNVTTISDCPIKDEWHYVKDGEYPTNEKDVEVLYRDCDKINIYNCIYDIHAENWLYYNLDDMLLERFPYSVIAWKEIITPKEIE